MFQIESKASSALSKDEASAAASPIYKASAAASPMDEAYTVPSPMGDAASVKTSPMSGYEASVLDGGGAAAGT